MPELRVTQQTTLQQLATFGAGVKDGHQIRAETQKDGSIRLYSKDPSKFSFGFKSKQRAGKFELARATIDTIVNRAIGSDRPRADLLSSMFRNQSGAVLPSAMNNQIEIATAIHDQIQEGVRTAMQGVTTFADVQTAARDVPGFKDAVRTASAGAILSGENPALNQTASRFFASRFIEENCVFLQAVQAFKQNPTPAAADRLIHDFLRPGADQEVNVSSSLVKDVTDARKSPNPNFATMFDATATEITQVLDNAIVVGNGSGSGTFPQFVDKNL